MAIAEILSRIAAELALFAGVGFLLFAINDLARRPDLFRARHLARAGRSTRATRAPSPASCRRSRSRASSPLFVPAWDEASVIASMLRATIDRLDYANYRIFVGHYRNDPATAAAIASVDDPRIEIGQVEADGPTTKADCLNHLYDALVAYETATGCSTKAVVLHDAEDVVHPLELRIFDRLIDRAAVIQLPVLPLPDPQFALDQRPLLRRIRRGPHQGAGRARSGRRGDSAGRRRLRDRPARRSPSSPRMEDGQPFAGGSMTEDYEVGLKIGALGLKTMFVRIPARPGERGVVASRGHFPATLGDAVRQKARWLGGIALAGWDRLGWSGGLGERWMRLARPPRPARRFAAARRLRRGPAVVADVAGRGARRADQGAARSDACHLADDQRLVARLAGADARAASPPRPTGCAKGLFSIPRLVVGNVIAMLAAARAVSLHLGGGAQALGQDPAHLPRRASAMRPSLRFLGVAVIGWAGLRAAAHGVLPGAEIFRIERERSQGAADRPDAIPADRAAARAPVPTWRPDAFVARRLCAYAPARPRTAAVPVYYAAARRCRHCRGARRASTGVAARAGAAILRPHPAARRMAAVAHRIGSMPAIALERGHARSKQPGRASCQPARPAAAERLGAASAASRAESPGPRSLASGRHARRKPGRSAARSTMSRARSRRRLRTTSEVGRRGGEVAAGHAHPAGRRHPGVVHRRAPPAARPIRRRPQRLRLVPRRRRLRPADAVAVQPRRLSPGRRGRLPPPRPLHRRRLHPDPPGLQAILRRPRRVGRRRSPGCTASMPARASACACATTCASMSIGASGSPAMPRPARARRVTLAGDF